jgi:site-specific recombinase XerD
MRTIRYPEKFQPKPKATHLETVRLMLEMAGNGEMGIRNRAIILFLLDTGCRAGGICGLRTRDIDLSERRALVTEKGNKTRSVTFTSLTAQAVREWLLVRKPAPTLFYNITTLEPLTPSGLLQLLRRIARRAGIRDRFNPHSFRHLFAKEYILAGGDLATLSKLLGHRDVSTTVSHYTIFTDSDLREKHELYSPVTKLKGERILRTRESEAYVVCEGINGANRATLPIYLAWELQDAYAFVQRELAGDHWEMLHYPNGYGYSPVYILDRSWSE